MPEKQQASAIGGRSSLVSCEEFETARAVASSSTTRASFEAIPLSSGARQQGLIVAYPQNIVDCWLRWAQLGVLGAGAVFCPARAWAEAEPRDPGAASVPAADGAPRPEPSAGAAPLVAPVETAAAAATPTSASEPPATDAPRKRPWAINLAFAHNTLSGDDFNGSQALIRGAESGGVEGVVIPELGSGSGFLLGLGYGLFPQGRGSFGFWSGLTYGATWLSPHSPNAPATSDSAILHDLEIQLKIAYRPSRSIIPYAQLAVGYGFLPITGFHAMVDPTSGNVAFDDNSVLLASRSFCFGLGSLFPITEGVSVDAFAGYRAFIVSSVDGQDLDDSLNAGGWQFHLGPAFFL